MMKKFDENYVLLEEMEKDSYFPDFLVEEVRETLRPVIRLLEGGERDTEVIQEKLDEAVCAVNDPSIEKGISVLAEAGSPCVTFNSVLPGSRRLCFVGQDIRKAGRVAAGLMRKCLPPECTVLAMVGNLKFDGHRQRLDGFRVYLGDVQPIFPAQGLNLLLGDGRLGGVAQGLEANQAAEPACDFPQDSLPHHGPPGRLVFLKQPFRQLCRRGGCFLRLGSFRLEDGLAAV